MSAEQRTRKARRRWWQVLLRVVLLLAVVLAGAYVTLPWWAPTRLIRQVLARDMSRQMGVGVRIGQMRLSWSEGIELQELIVDSPAGFGAGPMLHVRRIRAELSPINFFLRRRIEWMEVFGLQLFARVNAAGDVNLRPLKDLAFDAVARRISVRQASAALLLPGHERLIRLNVSDLQVLAGRIAQVGRVTMSADLQQEGGVAPVSLHLSEGAEADPVAGTATFTFANVDLAQVPLVRLLSPMVRKFAGRCDGSIELKLNRQGIVVPFHLNVSIRDLDVQPARGPTLPVIKAAGLRIAATYDVITGRLDISSGRFRLPGIDDLAGSGTFFLDLKQPRAIARSIKLSGSVYPGRLASLLTGRAQLPGGLGVSGPVVVIASVDHRQDAVRLDLSMQADQAGIHRAGKTIKPPGRKLALRIKGQLDTRTWTFTTDRIEGAEFTLGTNWLRGTGGLHDLRGIAERWADPAGWTIRQAVADIGDLSWNGKWEISDLDALRDLWPGGPRRLDRVRLDGKIRGRCAIDLGAETVLRADATLPADANLAAAGLFAIPAGREARLAVSGALVPGEPPGLRDTQLTLIVGGGRAHVFNGYVRLTGQAGQPGVELGGGFDVKKVQALLACLPAARLAGATVRGEVRDGSLRAGFGPTRQWARAELDLTGLDLALGEAFAKPAGRKMNARLSLRRTGRSNRHSLALHLPKGRIDAALAFVGTGPQDALRAGRATWKADLADAGWLVRAAPGLRRLLAGGRIAGPALLQAWARWAGEDLAVDLICDADRMTYESGGAVRRAKAPGVGLGAAISLRVRAGADGGPGAAVVAASGDVEFGRSRFMFEAATTADLLTPVLDPPKTEKARDSGFPGISRTRFGTHPRALRKLNGRIDASCVLEPALLELAPELGDLARRHGLAGAVHVTASADMRGDSAGRVRFDLDADRLAVGQVLVERVGRFTKPAGWPGRVAADVTFAHDLSNVRLRELYARIGDVHCTAAGTGRVLHAPGKDPELQLAGWRVAISTKKAETLHRILPAMKEYELAGDAFLDVQWEDGPAGGRIPRGEIHARQLRGRLGGKQVAVGGSVLARRVSGLQEDFPSIGRIVTDDLSFRIGRNHGWILADLVGIGAAPAGSVSLLAGYLDDKDLTDWVGRMNRLIRGGPPARKPAPDPPTEAWRIIAKARNALANANLALRGSFDRLRTYDAKVQQFYEVRQIEVAAAVNRGLVRLRYAGGISGGTVRARAEADLAGEHPAIELTTTYDGVLASESILPQLQRFFPGNTLYGSFSREEKITVPLPDFLANLIDPRRPVAPVGTAKIVAEDGLVEGRAAPHFVAAIFPGLNLAKYRYDRMTAFTTFGADGVAESDMIFNGPVYDMYMEGTTDPEQIARYEVGIILLSSPQSPEWNHKLRLGRIPILKVKGRIQKGKLVDDEVSYPWPTEAMFTVFLKNNIFYRVWLDARKPK